tara:strand:- start:989 stop:1192 length:204 start_codon:yes stop_codon:yes gene_type:complete
VYAPHIAKEKTQMSDRYFKKASGDVFKVLPQHDIKSLKDRFTECDKDGKEIKESKPKKKKAKVKDGE